VHAQSVRALWHGRKAPFDRERGVNFQIGSHVQRGACLASYRGPSQYHALWAWIFIPTHAGFVPHFARFVPNQTSTN
jgi:hypothetical protein